MGNHCTLSTKDDHFLLKKSLQSEMHFRNKPPLGDPQLIGFPLSTEGACIVDRFQRRVKLAFVNWSGSHMCRHCVDGLEFRNLNELCEEIRNTLGFNGVRLTFSLQMYYENPVIQHKYLAANPELEGKSAMEVFDAVVNAITRAGLMIILDNHVSSSMQCCSKEDGEGLWWTQEYPEYKWIGALRHFAQRYAHNPRVIGIDLRNQIRSTPHYSPTWGDGNVLTDWKKAAVEGGNQVLKINPNLLIFVGGLNFGLDLTGVKTSPIKQLMVPHKLVYTGHFYEFSWPVLSWRTWSYSRFKEEMYNRMSFVRAMGVPFWLGEFGSDVQDIPWNLVIQWLRESDVDWCYWALDGFKCESNDDETFGIYANNFMEPRNPSMLRDLQSVMKSSTYSDTKSNIND